MEIWARWVVGLVVALAVGGVVTGWFLKGLRSYLNIAKPSGRDVPNWLIGLSERLFFTVIVAFNVSGAAVAMMVWIVIKIVPNWELHVKHGTANKPLTWSSILASLCSMFFAILGGLIISGRIWWWPG
ncbi:MAG: hypothetical protein JSV86_17855 [Gemmatimonadota bacterium]|nr:MAG: hypothetical protein JSV86_17855 [Gemmatimonadota bacterium]